MAKVTFTIEAEVIDLTGDNKVDLSDMVKLAHIFESAQTKVHITISQ